MKHHVPTYKIMSFKGCEAVQGFIISYFSNFDASCILFTAYNY